MSESLTLHGSTGGQWAKNNPDQAAKALLLFADGESLRTIAAETGAAVRTVHAYLRSAGVWGACAKAIAATARVALKQLADRMVAETDDVPIEAMGSAVKSMIDLANMDGAPTTVIEHRHTHAVAEPSLESAAEFKRRLLERRAAIEAQSERIPVLQAIGQDE